MHPDLAGMPCELLPAAHVGVLFGFTESQTVRAARAALVRKAIADVIAHMLAANVLS